MRVHPKTAFFAASASAAACLALFFQAGCRQRTVKVKVRQPIRFNHKVHVRYFLSGKHRAEKIKMHLAMLGEKKAPAALQQGRCLKCHVQKGGGDGEPLSTKKKCASCHLTFQDPLARKNRARRPCLGCHGSAWNGDLASIPSVTKCKSCHGKKRRSKSEEEKKLLVYIKGDNGISRDIPWMQLHTLSEHVFFSHSVHVRKGFDCTRCHPPVRGLTAPPDTVVVYSMDGCIDCHVRHQASVDCAACHR